MNVFGFGRKSVIGIAETPGPKKKVRLAPA
jgi:hypothetical protein